jgi:CBS domain-containing membrane protein
MGYKKWNAAGIKFKSLWKNYLLQSSLAIGVVFIIILILSLKDAVIISSIGATAFIIFAAPSSPTAQPAKVIGGEIIGCLCGGLGLLMINIVAIPDTFIYSIAIGLSIFIMLALDLYQPPAGGTALGIAISGSPLKVLLTVLISMILLSIAHRYLKKYLKDLV